MEDKAVRMLTIRVLVLSILIGCALFYLPSFTSYVEVKIDEFKTIRAAIKAREEMSALDLLSYNTEQMDLNSIALREEIRLYLPNGVTEEDVLVIEDYVEKRWEFVVPRSRESDLNLNPIVGSSKYISDMSVWEENDGLHVSFLMDMVIEPVLRMENEYCYIKFYKPKELYDHVIVVDAGHGGEQPGTVKSGYVEKNINLEIVEKMKEILDTKENVKVYYTRLTDVDIPLQQRVQLVKDSEADLFVSIHQNAVTRSASSTKGVQVLYDESAPESETNSLAFARLCRDEVIAATGCENKGVTKGDAIYIVRECGVPVALVECGFMSHSEELKNLASEEYQEKIAIGICNAIDKAIQGGF